ncbi:uncharacterized protein G2W53_018782 [Senna tora]|uniref:Uncharacterized protein n=1 Tax=Senna tora TaxID=362788 RepID=A0A834TT26_9FABA|nr:uncharacterized protein G2W53_018782 [Senna tora]
MERDGDRGEERNGVVWIEMLFESFNEELDRRNGMSHTLSF